MVYLSRNKLGKLREKRWGKSPNRPVPNRKHKPDGAAVLPAALTQNSGKTQLEEAPFSRFVSPQGRDPWGPIPPWIPEAPEAAPASRH